MLTAAFSFLTQMIPTAQAAPSSDAVAHLRDHLLAAAETDATGQKSLKINLPSEEALTQLAESLARLLSFQKPTEPSKGSSA